MSVERIKGLVQVVVSGAVILAAALLVILNLPHPAQLNLYGPVYTVDVDPDTKQRVGAVPTGVLMLCSAAGGLLLFWMAKMMIRGIAALRRAHKQAQARDADDPLKPDRAAAARDAEQAP